MKIRIYVLILFIFSVQLRAQDKLIVSDDKIRLNIIYSSDNDNFVDVTIVENISNNSYTIKNAFFHAKQDIFLYYCDLDDDNINEYVLSGLTGGNGIPYGGYIIDLKISTKPVCIVGSCCNPDGFNYIIGNVDRKRIIMSENSKYPYFYCYKYLNGRLHLESNKEDVGFKLIYEQNISKLKYELDDRRDRYWENGNSIWEYKMILESYLMQNVIVYDDYNIENEANYYNYYFKSENKEMIGNIKNRYSNLLNDNCLFKENNDY